MPKPTEFVTPDKRVDRWKKYWGTPKRLSETETEDAFDELQNALVPRHMHKQFLKFFGQPKQAFGNRFYSDEAVFVNWDTRIGQLVGAEGANVEVTVIYGSPDRLEGHLLKGERRRTLRDIVVDDWFGCCGIVRSARMTLYFFLEHKGGGCIVRTIKNPNAPDEAEMANGDTAELVEEA